MKAARVVAIAVALAAGVAVYLWVKGKAVGDGEAQGDARRAATQIVPRSDDSLPPPAVAPVATRDPERAEAAAAGDVVVLLDLRGPDGSQLAAALVHAEPESASGAPAKGLEAFDSAWRPDAPTLQFSPNYSSSIWTLVAEGESDVSLGAIPCGEFVSDPIPLDPRIRRSAPLVIRLHLRPGIFGQVHGVPISKGEKIHAEVRWRALATGQSIGATELALTGRTARLVRCRDEFGNLMGGVAYVVHDLAPGRYAVGGRGDLGGPLEAVCEIEVGDSMVRQDLSLALIDAATMMHALVRGVDPDEAGTIAFQWIGGAPAMAPGEQMQSRSDGPGSYWIAPSSDVARVMMMRLLDGALAADERAAVALTREGAAIAAQPVSNGQREIAFDCTSPARVTIRLVSKANDGTPKLRVALVPAAAETLLGAPPGMSHAVWLTGPLPATIAEAAPNYSGLVPGDFVLVTWGQLPSALRHGEVWWPLARRDVVVKSGDQELVLDAPPLHPLTIRFDVARFGKGARVQVVLRSYPQWPLFAIPDENGIANFPSLPDGDYTVTVVGDMAGEKDFTIPGTSELHIEPTRREEH